MPPRGPRKRVRFAVDVNEGGELIHPGSFEFEPDLFQLESDDEDASGGFVIAERFNNEIHIMNKFMPKKFRVIRTEEDRQVFAISRRVRIVKYTPSGRISQAAPTYNWPQMAAVTEEQALDIYDRQFVSIWKYYFSHNMFDANKST